MTDESNLTPTPEALLTNSPEARTMTGEIKDQSLSAQTTPPTPKAPAAPESYTFTAPEGAKLDDAIVADATPVFKELGLTQDQAQTLVNWYAKQASSQSKAIETAVANMRAEWVSQIKADPEIGSKLNSHVIPEIGRLKDQLEPGLRREFEAAMNLTGAGDHPAFIKAFYALAQRVNEGTHVTGLNPSPNGQSSSGVVRRPSAAAAMFPGLPSAS